MAAAGMPHSPPRASESRPRAGASPPRRRRAAGASYGPVSPWWQPMADPTRFRRLTASRAFDPALAVAVGVLAFVDMAGANGASPATAAIVAVVLAAPLAARRS